MKKLRKFRLFINLITGLFFDKELSYDATRNNDELPVTIDRILEHANRMYSKKLIKTKLPNGEMVSRSYADLYIRSQTIGTCSEKIRH